MQGFGPSAAGPGSGASDTLEGNCVELLLMLAVVLAAGLGVGVIARLFVVVTVVHDYERGLRFRNGRLAGLVDAGSHVAIRPFSELRVMDARPTFVPLDGQEILTADGVVAKISLVAGYVVADAVAAVTRDADFRRTLYFLLQLALRDAVSRRTLEEVLAGRRELGPEVREACTARLGELGVELLEVEVRDVMLPSELKRAYAGVVAARKDGQVALERARAETAVLRSMANTGRMLEDSPGLLQLRILQQLGESSGSTVVYGAPEPPVLPRPATGSPRTRAPRAATDDPRA